MRRGDSTWKAWEKVQVMPEQKLTDQQQSTIASGARLIATVMDPRPPEGLSLRWVGTAAVVFGNATRKSVLWSPFAPGSPVPGFPGLTFGESRALRLCDVDDLDAALAQIGLLNCGEHGFDTCLWLTEIAGTPCES